MANPSPLENLSRLRRFFLKFTYLTKYRFTLAALAFIIITFSYLSLSERQRFLFNAIERESGATAQKEQNMSLYSLVESVETEIDKRLLEIKKLNLSEKLLLDDDTGTTHLIRLTTVTIPDFIATLHRLYVINETVQPDNPLYPSELKFQSRKLEQLSKKASRHLDQYFKRNTYISRSEEGLALVNDMRQWQNGLVPLIITMEEGARQESASLLTYSQIKNSIGDILENTKQLQNSGFEQLIPLLQAQKKGELTIYITVLICMTALILLLIVYFFNSHLSRPLLEFRKGAQKLLEGDFSYRIPICKEDETKEIHLLFNQIAMQLEKSFNTTEKTAEVLSKQAITTNSLTKDLHEKIKRQDHLINSVSDHARKIALSTNEISKALTQIAELVKTTSMQANQGELRLGEMEESIGKMQQSADHVITSLSQFQEKVGKTSDVINLIVKIVDQANLLSINSAINATRPGAQEGGFVVISNEIRDLANQSAYFTLDIEKKVSEIIPHLSAVSGLVTSFSKKVHKQSVDMNQIKTEIRQFIHLTKNQMGTFTLVHDGMLKQASRANKIDLLSRKQSELSHHISLSTKRLHGEVSELYDSSSKLYDTIKKIQN